MKEVLYVSWQGGMGHITRDVAIAKELRRRDPEVHVSWIAHPLACKVLEHTGETILSGSERSADYNLALDQCIDGFGFNVFRFVGATSKAWAHNVNLFRELIAKHDFDLVIGDEAYELTKAIDEGQLDLRCRMVEIEDFVGLEAMTSNPLEHLGVYVKNRRLSRRPKRLQPRVTYFFVGELADVVDKPFGFGLPNRRDVARKYFDFPGYVIRFDPAEYANKREIRAKLGYGQGPLLLCATGGTSAGKELLELCGQAYTILKPALPDLHMVAVCGELFGKKPPVLPPEVELHDYIPDLYQHYAACDLAVVVGGGTTTIELTALRRPFVFFPLENQYDQQLYIPERLARQGAGIRMRFYETTPSSLAEVIKNTIGTQPTWPTIRTDGAARAATLINEILNRAK